MPGLAVAQPPDAQPSPPTEEKPEAVTPPPPVPPVPAPNAPASGAPAPNSAAAGTPAASPAAPTPPDMHLLPPTEAMPVLGHAVAGMDGKPAGRLVDILVGPDALPRAAVLDIGGFLGLGNRVVTVDWSALHFAPDDKGQPITVELTPDQIKAAPEYKDSSKPAAVVTPAGH